MGVFIVLFTNFILLAANQPPIAQSSSMTTFDGVFRQQLNFSATDDGPIYQISKKFTKLPTMGHLEYLNNATGKYVQIVKDSLYGYSVSYYYTANVGHIGYDTILWQAKDTGSFSNEAAMVIAKTENFPPVIRDTAVTVSEKTSARYLRFPFSDLNGVTWNYIIPTRLPSLGTLTTSTLFGGVTIGEMYRQSYLYFSCPAGNYGIDTVKWVVFDGKYYSDTALFVITIRQNNPPVAHQMTVSVLQDSAVSFSAWFRDADSIDQICSTKVEVPPVHGSISSIWGLTVGVASQIRAPGFRYIPARGFTGRDSFSWRVFDGVAYSAVTSCELVVRPSGSLGTMVLIVVHDSLLEYISEEVSRMRQDIIDEGYLSKIVSCRSNPIKSVWDTLNEQYRDVSVIMSGAVLIGRFGYPSAEGMGDRPFWNMGGWLTGYADKEDLSMRHIWVSRIYPKSYSGAETFGSQALLVKRALDCNHDYRKGIRRLTHNANYYCIPEYLNLASNRVSRLALYWSKACTASSLHNTFPTGSDLFEQTSHGNASVFGGGAGSHIDNNVIHTMNMQSRFIINQSCIAGVLGGPVCQQILSRNSAVVLAIGSTVTMHINDYSLINWMVPSVWETSNRARVIYLLRDGENWGSAWLSSGMVIDHSVFYGDMSLRSMMAPANKIPFVSNVSVASVESGLYEFTVYADDMDGSIANVEWWFRAYNKGMNSPDTITDGPTLRVPATWLRDTLRVEVIDNFRARATYNAVGLLPTEREADLLNKLPMLHLDVSPNPFKIGTSISFTMISEGVAEIKVYDISGRLVMCLLRGKKAAGEHLVRWNGKDGQNRPVAAGIYALLAVINGSIMCKKILLSE